MSEQRKSQQLVPGIGVLSGWAHDPNSGAFVNPVALSKVRAQRLVQQLDTKVTEMDDKIKELDTKMALLDDLIARNQKE